MNKYSKAIATIPGGIVGLTVAENLTPMIVDLVTQAGLVIPNYGVFGIEALIVVLCCGAAVYVAPKNVQ